MKTVKKATTYLLKDFRVLKLIFTSLTVVLLYDELLIFFIERPTMASIAKTALKPTNFPGIYICARSGFNQTELSKLGYEHGYKYSRGFPNDKHFIGWSGNQSDLSHEEVGVKISTIRTTEDCPRVVANFIVDNKKVRRTLILELTRGLYPSGRCCAAEIPAEAAQSPVYELDFLMDHNNTINQNIKEFKIILSDQTSSSIFQLHKFNMEGSPLEVSMKEEGYRKYRLKMFEEIHVEADPKFPCRMYQFAGEYDQCLEAEYVRQSQALLSCTPPWMTDRQEVWCPPALQISQHTADIMELLFDSIIDGKAQVGQCLVPCITTWSDLSRVYTSNIF